MSTSSIHRLDTVHQSIILKGVVLKYQALVPPLVHYFCVRLIFEELGSPLSGSPMGEESDDEAGFLPVVLGDMDDGEEEGPAETQPVDPEVARIERSVLLRQTPLPASPRFLGVASMASMILDGEYLRLINTAAPAPLHVDELISLCEHDEVIDRIKESVWTYLQAGAEGVEERVLECMLLGFAYLELFCQANYTGPEISDAALSPIVRDAAVASRIFENSLAALECDGNYCFRMCSIPQSLLISRILLSTLAQPEYASWKQGVCLGPEGDILRPPARHRPARQALAVLKSMRCPTWLNARATVIHAR